MQAHKDLCLLISRRRWTALCQIASDTCNARSFTWDLTACLALLIFIYDHLFDIQSALPMNQAIAKAVIITTALAGIVGFAGGYYSKTLDAASPVSPQQIKPDEFWLPDFGALELIRGDHNCVPPKYWTGNGCADTSKWTIGDWKFFTECVAKLNPKTKEGIYNCVRQTELGKPRK